MASWFDKYKHLVGNAAETSLRALLTPGFMVKNAIRGDHAPAPADTMSPDDFAPAPELPDYRQAFLDAFVGPSPGLPDHAAYLQPYDYAQQQLGAQYDANKAALQQNFPQLQQQLAAIRSQADQLHNIDASQAQAQAAQFAQQAGANTEAIQQRLAALGVNGQALAQQAANQQQAAQTSQGARDAYAQRMQVTSQGAQANAQSSAATAQASSLANLDANKAKALASILQGRAQAEAQYQGAANAANRDEYSRRVATVKALGDFEDQTSPLPYLRNSSPLDNDSLNLAIDTAGDIENGALTLNEALKMLADNTAEYEKNGYDPTEIAKELKRAYAKVRSDRDRYIKTLKAS